MKWLTADERRRLAEFLAADEVETGGPPHRQLYDILMHGFKFKGYFFCKGRELMETVRSTRFDELKDAFPGQPIDDARVLEFIRTHLLK